jgi:DNA-binding CsgD family transcriptional regulator
MAPNSPASPIGRASETAILERAVKEVAQGRKRTVLIRGVTGLGKTTLLYWVSHLASSSGFLCGMARAPAAGGLPPRFPLPELLSSLARERALQGDGTDDLLSETIAGLRGDRHDDSRPPDLLQIARVLESTSVLAPLALLVDDIQWTQPDERALLLGALRVAEAPVLFIATERTESNDVPPAIEPTADLPVDSLDLEGLPTDSVAELASRALGAPVLPSLSRSLHDHTLGNPLFALETLRAWRDSGQVIVVAGGYWGFGEDAVPEEGGSLRQVIAQRIRAIDPSPLAVAQALAVLGRPASLEEVRRIADIDGQSGIEALATLEDEGFVVHELSVGHRLSHPLFQTGLLSEMNRTREGALHGRIYEVLRDATPHRTSSELAYHAIRALEPPSEISDLLDAAATEAQRAGSYGEAAEWYARLIATAEDDASLVRALAGRASALEHFDAAEAASAYGQAAERTERGAAKAPLLLGWARALRMSGRHPEALEVLQDAASMAEPDVLDEIRHATAIVNAAQGRTQTAEELFRELARDTVGRPAHAKAIGHLGVVSYVRGHPIEALRLTDEALDECGDPSYRDYLGMSRAWFLVVVGRWEEAKALLETSIARAKRAHDTWNLVPLLASATRLNTWSGDSDRALDFGTQVVRLAATCQPMDQIGSAGALAGALLEEGAVEEAFDAVKDVPRLLEIEPELGELQHAVIVLAETHLRRGDLKAAQQTVGLARELVEYNEIWRVSLDRLTAQLELARGRPDQAFVLADRYARDPSEFAIEQAWITETSAEAAAASGRKQDALAIATSALDQYERLGARRRAQRVRAWIDARAGKKIGRPPSTTPGGLTEREAEILRHVAGGKTNHEIASELVISAGTVKKHVENIKSKLGVRRRTELAARYRESASPR